MTNIEGGANHTDSDPDIIAQKRYLERREAYHRSFSDFMKVQLISSDIEIKTDEYGIFFSVAAFEQFDDASLFAHSCKGAGFDVEVVEPAPGRQIAPHEKCFKVRQKGFIELKKFVEDDKSKN